MVIPLVHQTASGIVSGRFVASSPDFLWKSAAERREADLTRQIAHQQLSLAFGAGKACTKAFQIKTFFTLSSRTAKPIRDLVSQGRMGATRSPLCASLRRG
ncbi:MAG: hypothetical protein CFE27_11450 [Alphaproteobacteria bacterium PA1]|nr:MAG: hypothetical protein CFE27_11450 [Alphaproteobacteria bacterium PA1]